MPGHGARSSADSRRVINVRIDHTWGVNTDVNIWNGVYGCRECASLGALERWNLEGTWYYFDLKQDDTQWGSRSDIVIRMGKMWDANRNGKIDECAIAELSSDVNTTPHIITLPPEAKNWSQDQIACIVAHEIGHTIGLLDAFGSCDSIMNQSTEGCTKCIVNHIKQADVERANQHASNPSSCQPAPTPPRRLQITIPEPTPTPEPGGGGGGGGYNCYSYIDTARYWDSDGGSSCSHTYAISTTYCNGVLTNYYADYMYSENCYVF